MLNLKNLKFEVAAATKFILLVLIFIIVDEDRHFSGDLHLSTFLSNLSLLWIITFS